MSSIRFEAIYRLSTPIGVDSFYEAASTVKGKHWKVTKGGGRRTRGGDSPECQVIIKPDGIDHTKVEMLSPVKIKILSRSMDDIRTCCQNVLTPILYEFLESKGEIKLEFDQLLTYSMTHVPRELMTPFHMRRVTTTLTVIGKVKQKASKETADNDA